MTPHEDADIPIFLQLLFSKERNTNFTGGGKILRTQS